MAKGKMWGGRFAEDQDPVFDEFNRSLAFDRELLEADVAGSLAYARALERAGIFKRRERIRVEKGLREVLAENLRIPALVSQSNAEDIHSYVEESLGRRVGALALKLHTGRSRNDQVATDLRIYLKWQAVAIEGELTRLLKTIAVLVDRHGLNLLPGYTHLQLAQPVLFGHYLLAYGEMFLRDRQRLREAESRMSVCPLGSGALSGTVYAVNRAALARDLGFASASENSMDAVSDRDFVIDFLHFASLTMVHMSRIAEDLILYSSAEFGFVGMHDSVASGSSLMPQKKNPDALELIRGKCGRVFGHQIALLTVLKGLPLTYNKDLQEDKEGLFDALRSLRNSLVMLQRVLDSLEIYPARMEAAASKGYLSATELADYLAAQGMPFRKAHYLVGRVVRRASELDKNLEALSLADFRRFSPRFGEDLYRWLDLRGAVARRREIGGTSPAAMRKALGRFRKRMNS